MKKIYAFLFILLLVLPCCGCGSTTPPPLSQIETELLTVSQNLSGMVKGDGKALKRYYGLNLNDFEEVLIYIPENYMDVSELLVIKTKNTEQLDLVEEAINMRIAKQQESFAGYGPEQVALLDDYELKIIDNTLFYCVSPEAPLLKSTFVKGMNN